MKRVQNIKEPDTQQVGKIDISDLPNSSIPDELYYIAAGKLKNLKQGKTIKITVRKIITIHLKKINQL